MSFDDVINYSRAVHTGLKRGIEKEERKRAARATVSFIKHTIITTVISIVLSLLLPLWLVGVLLLVYGLIRIICAASNIEFALTGRNLLKALGLWDKNNDMIIIWNIIWGAIVFILIKIINYVIVI